VKELELLVKEGTPYSGMLSCDLMDIEMLWRRESAWPTRGGSVIALPLEGVGGMLGEDSESIEIDSDMSDGVCTRDDLEYSGCID